MSEPDHPQRRLFGRRHGKPLRPKRQKLLEARLPALRIEVPAGASGIDPAVWFDFDPAEIWLEIGFGKGEHLAWQASEHPQYGFIGVEPFITGMAGLIAAIDQQNLHNIRVFDDDAALLLAALRPASLARIFILFPDPWPKRRHHKRRFVRPDNIDLLAAALAPGGLLRVATDDPGYCQWIVRHMNARADFEWLAERPDDWRTRPLDWPQTRYEEKASAQGRSSVYLVYRRK